MAQPAATELYLIRHAPVAEPGRMAGRRDVPADTSDTDTALAVAAFCGAPDRVITSPALRCRATAAALWPGQNFDTDARLWEQDFGRWEGQAHADLPDLGVLDSAALAAHRPPSGESFLDVADRLHPVLEMLRPSAAPCAIVAHAGVVRAALGLALGQIASGLCFAVAPWSVTRLTLLPDQGFAIGCVNWRPDARA